MLYNIRKSKTRNRFSYKAYQSFECLHAHLLDLHQLNSTCYYLDFNCHAQSSCRHFRRIWRIRSHWYYWYTASRKSSCHCRFDWWIEESEVCPWLLTCNELFYPKIVDCWCVDWWCQVRYLWCNCSSRWNAWSSISFLFHWSAGASSRLSYSCVHAWKTEGSWTNLCCNLCISRCCLRCICILRLLV